MVMGHGVLVPGIPGPMTFPFFMVSEEFGTEKKFWIGLSLGPFPGFFMVSELASEKFATEKVLVLFRFLGQTLDDGDSDGGEEGLAKLVAVLVPVFA